MLEVFQDSRLKIRDLGVVWLDFANEYGALTHLFILKALRFYHIPDNFIKFILVNYSGAYGRFSSKLVTSKLQKIEIGILWVVLSL